MSMLHSALTGSSCNGRTGSNSGHCPMVMCCLTAERSLKQLLQWAQMGSAPCKSRSGCQSVVSKLCTRAKWVCNPGKDSKLSRQTAQRRISGCGCPFRPPVRSMLTSNNASCVITGHWWILWNTFWQKRQGEFAACDLHSCRDFTWTFGYQ